MVMRTLGLLAVLTAACALGPAVTAAGEPITVRDGLDRVVTLPAPPRRIVTIFASNTEMVAALGLTDRIVGIEAYTRHPPEVVSKPLVGGRLGFSVDAMVGLRPDLVVVTPARQAVNQAPRSDGAAGHTRPRAAAAKRAGDLRQHSPAGTSGRRA
jgi:iron complex transport system substrate-binding protein